MTARNKTIDASVISAVPTQRRTSFYIAAQWSHRAQAALARRRARMAGDADGTVRILCYHRVDDAPDELAVHPRAFREQMEIVVASGAVPTALDDALDRLDAGETARSVCITFDDAYYDNLENALPVLEDLGIPATIFVPSAIVDGTAAMYWYRNQPRLLSWDELQGLCRDGFISVGAHSRTHPALPNVSDEQAWDEIAGSKRDIEERTGCAATTFAYPGGIYGGRELHMVREAGFRAGLTCDPGANGPEHRREALRRAIIDRRDSRGVFEAKLLGALDKPWSLSRFRRDRNPLPN